MKRRGTILECDFCQKIQVDKGMETLGLRIYKADYSGPSFGGILPKDLFICENCVDDNPALVRLVRLID